MLHSYVLAACVSTFFVGAWHGGRVGGFRKAAKIPYPYEYASYEQVQTAIGYSRSGEDGGKGRYYGALGIIAHYVLLLMSGKAAFDLVMG